MISDLEQAIATQIKMAGLPKPQTEFRAIDGRRYRFDFAWPEHKLLLEVQGGVWVKSGHSTGGGITRDAEKANLAVLAGWRVMHVTVDHITSGQALRWIQAALSMAEVG